MESSRVRLKFCELRREKRGGPRMEREARRFSDYPANNPVQELRMNHKIPAAWHKRCWSAHIQCAVSCIEYTDLCRFGARGHDFNRLSLRSSQTLAGAGHVRG